MFNIFAAVAHLKDSSGRSQLLLNHLIDDDPVVGTPYCVNLGPFAGRRYEPRLPSAS